MVDVLEQIRQYADDAHGEQTRKYSDERYIVHPVRVMEICRSYTQDITVLAAALLHDILEDTAVTKEMLWDFLNHVFTPDQAKKTFLLVEELTDIYVKKAYPSWNRRKRKMKEADRMKLSSIDAQTIKYADIIDNCPEITEKDPEFAERFLRECRSLLRKIKKGDQDLYRRAITTVNNCLVRLKAGKKVNPIS